MPLPPPPLTYDCPQCGWRKTTAPKSDALRPGEFFACCSECGNRDLIVTAASPWAAWLARQRERWASRRLRTKP